MRIWNMKEIHNVNLKSEYSCEIKAKMIPEHWINDGTVHL